MQAAAAAQEQAEAEELDRTRRKLKKKNTNATIETSRETPEGCIGGLQHTCEDLGGELKRVWVNRHEVFLPVFNSDENMNRMGPGGRAQVISGVFKAIGEYDKMPYGLKLPAGAMYLLCPELSEAATKSMCAEPSMFAALVTRIVSQMSLGADKDAIDNLWSRRAELQDLVIDLGGFKIPFIEDKPVTYPSGESLPKGHKAVFGFGNRVELFATLRNLFLRQSLFMAIRAVLAKAYELGILQMQDVAGKKEGDESSQNEANGQSLDVNTKVTTSDAPKQ